MIIRRDEQNDLPIACVSSDNVNANAMTIG